MNVSTQKAPYVRSYGEGKKLPGVEWDLFQLRGARLSQSPEVTIQARGSLSLNKAARDALGNPEAVELLYAAKEKLIGIRAAKRDNPYSYPLREISKSSFAIAAGGFSRYYNIPTGDTARRYKAKMYDDVLGVSLKEEPITVLGSRSKQHHELATAAG